MIEEKKREQIFTVQPMGFSLVFQSVKKSIPDKVFGAEQEMCKDFSHSYSLSYIAE